MPTIAFFYGITIQMFFNDHNPPHIHARYGNARALIRIADGVIISGELPKTAERLVSQWVALRRSELDDNWRRARAMRPLENVKGPDGE